MIRWLGSDAAPDRGRGFLWWPVAFGAGAGCYFVPVDEPDAIWATGAAVIAGSSLLVLLVLRRLPPFPLWMALLAIAGYGDAAVLTGLAAHPVLTQNRSYRLTGWVEAADASGRNGMRLIVRPWSLAPPPPSDLPPRIAVSVASGGRDFRPGDGLLLSARLGPPSPPVLPGGYDFARRAWFSGVGGTGFSFGKPVRWSSPPPDDTGFRLTTAIAGFRLAVAYRIRAAVPGDAGGIAAALIVGDRGGISAGTNEAMRVAGLSHILSISGVHMSLVAACLFAAIRRLAAAIPRLVLYLPVKKIAAVAALAGTSAYFVVSGMDVPAERSLIMVAVSLAAVLLDRQALSMRVIALAALVTLVLSPEAVVDPGAQMSFAAVVALIAGLEALRKRAPPADAGDIHWLPRLLAASVRWVLLALATSLIAGLATAPVAVYHFGRLAPLGLLANLLAAPLVSLLIMPSAMISALAMAVGLEAVPLRLMGEGVDLLIAVATVTADWTPAGAMLGRPPAFAVLTLMMAGLCVCLVSGPRRWLAVPVMLVSLVAARLAPTPDLLVAGDGSALAMRDHDGRFRLLGKATGFTRALWQSAVGADLGNGRAREPDICDGDACLLDDIAWVTRPIAFGEECALTAVVVSPLSAPPWCRPAVRLLDGPALSASGAASYTVDRDTAGHITGIHETGRVLGQPPRRWYGFPQK